MNRLTRFLLLVSLLGFSKLSPLFAKGEGYPVGTVHIDLQGNVVPLAGEAATATTGCNARARRALSHDRYYPDSGYSG